MESCKNTKNYVHVTSIPTDRLSILQNAVSNILFTPLAFDTFAQVVDGLPLGHVAEDYGHSRRDFDANTQPSQEARAAVERHRKAFDLSIMRLEGKLAQAYQDAEEGSKDYSIWLLEILAVLLHDVAVFLFKEYDGGIRKAGPPELPKPIRFPDGREMKLCPLPIFPTDLYHAYYQQFEQYPNGVADIVGYWVEYRLFGGVVLFDRGKSGKESKNAFIHPVRGYRIFQVSDAQLEQFTQLVESKDGKALGSGEVLRFKAERTTRREDPWDAMHHLNIYRDRYERNLPEKKPFHCVVMGDDYPELEEQNDAWIKRRRERDAEVDGDDNRSKKIKMEEPPVDDDESKSKMIKIEESPVDDKSGGKGELSKAPTARPKKVEGTEESVRQEVSIPRGGAKLDV